MFRKMMVALCIAVLFSLLGGGVANAGQGLLEWGTVFDPAPYMPGEYYMIDAVEEYNNELYLVAGDPGWFHPFDPAEILAGQVFHSPDGVNWAPASELGFGLGSVADPYCGANFYDFSMDMVVFKGELYTFAFDTCYNRPGVILRMGEGGAWETVVTTEELGISWPSGDVTGYGQFHKFAVFEGMLYASVDYYDPLTQFTASAVFRSPTAEPGTWEEVVVFPGWGWPGTFQVFKGALYVGSDGIYQPPDWMPLPEQIWRTFDGVNWEPVVGDGFGNSVYDGLGGFAEYKGYLYVGAANYVNDGPNQLDPGGQIWRTQDGQTWELVMADGFGNPLDEKIDGLIVYHGDLCAYTVNWMEGGSLFCSKDGLAWERASEPGWGNPLNAASHHTSAQVVFKDDLYMGMVGPQGGLLKLTHP